MADLASIISGTDPLAPLVLQAEQQQQLLNSARDASQWANQGPFGALARTLAGFSGGGAQNTLQQITQQRAAAQPDVFQALASPNAYQWGANHPQASPLALAGVLANAPAAARAGLEGAQAGQITNRVAAFPQIIKSVAGSGAAGVAPPTSSQMPPSLSPSLSEETIQGALPAAQAVVQYANTLPPGAARARALIGQPPAVQAAIRRYLQQSGAPQ